MKWIKTWFLLFIFTFLFFGYHLGICQETPVPKKHLVVISVDALGKTDFEYIKKLPHFKYLIHHGVMCKNVTSVYPSLTFPAHASILTGAYPNRHGIVQNEIFQPFEPSPNWYFEKRYMQSPMLIDLAKQQKLTVAGILWPVLAKADMDYNFPQIWPLHHENQAWLLLKNGTPFFVADILLRFGRILHGTHQPYLDDFTTEVTCYTLKTKKPDVIFSALMELDEIKHQYGIQGKMVTETLQRMDQRLGKILTAIRKAGLEKETVVVVLGDHGMADVHTKICLNIAFKKAGLISEKRKQWKAYASHGCGSAVIYVKDPMDQATLRTVNLILNTLPGIEKIYTPAQLSQKGTMSGCAYMVEAKEGTYFADDLYGKDVIQKAIGQTENMEVMDHSKFRAMHGYDPNKESMKTVFMISGPGIRKNQVLESMRLIDITPTLASIWNLKFNSTDGKIINELFTKKVPK